LKKILNDFFTDQSVTPGGHQHVESSLITSEITEKVNQQPQITASSSIYSDNYANQTIIELKSELRKRKLKVSGKK